MKLLHRHIFEQVMLTSLAAVGVVTFVMMLGNALKDLLGPVLAGQLAPEVLLHLIWLLPQFVVSYALPMGILTGVLLVLGRMSADREITAIRAAGVSVAGISSPIFFFALLGVIVSGAVNFYLMPRSKVAYEAELADALRQNPLSFILPKTFIRDFPGRVIYVGDKRGEVLEDIWVWELDKQSRVVRSGRARSGRIAYDEPNNQLLLTLNSLQFELHDPKDPEDTAKVRSGGASDRATFELSLEKLTGRRSVNVKLKWLTLPQLLAEWRRLGQPDPAGKASGAERATQRIKVQTVIQEKAATAFSVLAFALIAVPLGIKVSRKETSANLGIALALAMGYYFVTVVVGWFDNKPDWRPDLLMWIPNLGFQALGIWMFYRVDRR